MAEGVEAAAVYASLVGSLNGWWKLSKRKRKRSARETSDLSQWQLKRASAELPLAASSERVRAMGAGSVADRGQAAARNNHASMAAKVLS